LKDFNVVEDQQGSTEELDELEIQVDHEIEELKKVTELNSIQENER